jgi:hypothetical protein
MNFEYVLRREAAATVTELNQLYGSLQISQLPEFAEAIEALLPNHVASRLVANCTRVVAGARRKTRHPTSWIKSKGIEFDIVVGERVGAHEELDVAFLRRDVRPDTSVVLASTLRLNEAGRYKVVVVEKSIGLEVQADKAAKLAAVIVETAYRWMRETITGLVQRQESDLILELYAAFRSACINGYLREMAVFGAVSNGRSVYLIDTEYAAHALALASAQSPLILESPSRILAEILNSDIPYDLSFSKEAIEGTKRVFDLRRTRYEELKGPLLPLAEAVIIGSASVAAFPVVRDGDHLLVVVAPRDLREELQRTLATVGPILSSRFTSRRGLLKQILSRLKTVGITDAIGDVSFWGGRFLDGVLRG